MRELEYKRISLNQIDAFGWMVDRNVYLIARVRRRYDSAICMYRYIYKDPI